MELEIQNEESMNYRDHIIDSNSVLKYAKMILTKRTHQWKHCIKLKYLDSVSNVLGKDLSWFFNWVFGFVQAAAKGFSIKLVITILLYLVKRKHFKKTLAGVFSKDTLSFSMYCGLMVGLYKATIWILRSFGKTNDKINAIIAGVVCSLSAIADSDEDRRKTIILYTFARAFETSINFSNTHSNFKISENILTVLLCYLPFQFIILYLVA